MHCTASRNSTTFSCGPTGLGSEVKWGSVMSQSSATVDKALGLLDFFNARRPSIGLSELARMSGHNKATALRFLTALESRGFVEQDPESKVYHIGPAFLRFAQLRETSFPWALAVEATLRQLVDETEETSHAAILAGHALATIGQVESPRSNRVILEAGEALPLHATASGLVFLAHADARFVDDFLQANLVRYTDQTPTDAAEIREKFGAIREVGYSRSSGTYEDDVVGFAAPYFGPDGTIVGTIAVALPKVRAAEEREAAIIASLLRAAHKLTTARGGQPERATGDAGKYRTHPKEEPTDA
ncbi:IclR family transcriptional regulator [Marimonas sp. MJW-29]|uniref:IclR family transcriptional regulator n=1 Tax=Sulfitobacter sediminis TaxID=3234186 RepID=A0ABV3RJN7_9RHOB